MNFSDRLSRRGIFGTGVLAAVVVFVGLIPWRLVGAQAKQSTPTRTEDDLFVIDVLRHGTRLTASNKSTGNVTSLDVPEGTRVIEVFHGDDGFAACVTRGSLLIVFNGRHGNWSTFPLPNRDSQLEARPIVGDRLACYQLTEGIVAYSASKNTWRMLATSATPAVGDYEIFVEAPPGRYVFTAVSGNWKYSQR